MTYNIIEKNDKLIIQGLEHFHPKHIFECGQCFRWFREEDGSYTTISGGKVLNILENDEGFIVDLASKEDWENYWHHYFDLDRDYGKIKEELSHDPILKESIEFGYGMRILNQEPYETTISFIISANNGIPRIKNAVNAIAKDLGDHLITYKGKEIYSFPQPDKLAGKTTDYIKEKYRVGFRSDRIREVSRRIAEGEFDIQCIFDLDHKDAQEMLTTLPGVGPKVSDCILLFAYDKSQAFPVDVWVKRVMEHFYFKRDATKKELESSGADIFGPLAGFAQQYLFYYARELGIGK